MALQFGQGQVADFAQADRDALANRGAAVKLEFASDEMGRTRRKRELAAESSNPAELADKMQKSGLIEDALELKGKISDEKKKTVDTQIQLLKLLKKSTEGVVDDNSYQAWRHKAIKIGAATEAELPTKYDDRAKKLIKRIGIGAEKLMKFGIDREKVAAKKKGGGAIARKDASLINNSAVELFGGTFDPETGRIIGLDKKVRNKVAALKSRAQRIFANSGGQMTHDEAVNQAADEMGIEIEDLGNRKKLPPGAKQIGTSGGKPVFEDAQGNRWIGE